MDIVRRKQQTNNRPTTNLSLHSDVCGEGDLCVVSLLIELEVVEKIKQRETRQICINPVARLKCHIWQTNVTNSKGEPSPRLMEQNYTSIPVLGFHLLF